MHNVDLYSLYVSRPVRLLVYLFGIFVIIYIGRLITAINEHTQELEKQVERAQINYNTIEEHTVDQA